MEKQNRLQSVFSMVVSIEWLTEWLIEWLTEWLIEWLAGRLIRVAFCFVLRKMSMPLNQSCVLFLF